MNLCLTYHTSDQISIDSFFQEVIFIYRGTSASMEVNLIKKTGSTLILRNPSQLNMKVLG